ncbi:MAG: hypothetical protein HUU20_11225 [Pirellulales bacterium]|nr:hypothetical protein [Pirellulales bacterium]
MDQRTLARMFDPFFSSKPRGSGLGLAMVRRIVDIHKGAIQVLSEPFAGSTFRVFFPTATHRNSTP